MSSIKKVTYKTTTGYRARWRTPDGRSRSKTFEKKRDAEKFLTSVDNAVLTGAYIDPGAGKITFKEYAERWRSSQVHRPGTAKQIEGNLRLHVYPRLGHRAMGSIQRRHIQELVRHLLDGDQSQGRRPLAPTTTVLIYTWISTIFKAAVSDRVRPDSPCQHVSLPTVERPKVVPLAVETIEALIAGFPARYRATIPLGAGTGVRLSEALGLTNDRIDWMRREVTIDRQLTGSAGGRPEFGPVKDRRNRPRKIPMSQWVVDALAEHIAQFGLGPEGLVFTSDTGGPLWRTTYADNWRRVAIPLGVPLGDGYHELRHFYASALIRDGRSVKEVQERLGHHSAQMTLDIYAHLWPEDDDRTRDAIDGLFMRPDATGPVTVRDAGCQDRVNDDYRAG